MKKIVVIPDSFKGTVSSIRFCEIARKVISRRLPGCETVTVPVADGGEGSVDAMLAACGGERIGVRVTGPLGEPVDGFYGILPDGSAIIEMAAAAGLPLAGDRKDPLTATTYGVGELMAHAVSRGAKKIVLGLGGSATNDGGCGAAAALGAVFTDESGVPFVPAGGTLERIAKIDITGLKSTLEGVAAEAMCDIDNPLFGPRGAAEVFAPQKGAGPDEVKLLDRGLRHLADVIRRDLGAEVSDLPGGGAAGGFGAGASAFFGARLKMGIETVLDTVGFDGLARDADLVVTGEGRLDGQSLGGKVVVGVAKRTRALGVPLIAVVGDIADDADRIYGTGVTAVFSINRLAIPFSEAKNRSERDLEATLDDVFRYTEAVIK